MINVEGYLEYRRECSVPWGDIMSTMGGVILSNVGGYHDARRRTS